MSHDTINCEEETLQQYIHIFKYIHKIMQIKVAVNFYDETC